MHVECNGELYNYEALINKYNIENYKTSCDTEVIMHVYDKVGIDATIRELDGIFAFQLADLRDPAKPLYFIGRDPIGIKPVFYGLKTVTDP